MAHELSKAVFRWAADRRYATRYLVGDGLDIGAGPDPLALHAEHFPLMQTCRVWDTIYGDGDAMLMEGVEDESFDFVVSSHCLEHVASPSEALINWVRVTRPDGHLILIVPDEDRYEQGVWPSTFNPDHKFSFTIHKYHRSWCSHSRSLLTLLGGLKDVELLKIEQLDANFRYGVPRHDQTQMLAESAIEIVLRKWTKDELDAGGRLPIDRDQKSVMADLYARMFPQQGRVQNAK
jgi:SAM-dependent methyltransferase